MAELKRYKTTINGLETHVQLTDEQAEAAGLSGGSAVPETPETGDKTTTGTVPAPADLTVGTKEADAPANKSRATRKND